ncbi:MAG: Asp23/Gls24 family envelope stress response protein [Coriobacteriales bacterium]|nr:Asp23/Gls24 family envelope stress response protein [Coriobacteriales bacterium]
MGSELVISGIGVSRDVVSTIVSLAAEHVEGVASVGENAIATGLISVFTSKPASSTPVVESEVENDKLVLSVRLSVFYGYPFTKLASDVRKAVAAAVRSQMGVEVSRVDVCIDSLVFPKE